MAAILSRTDIRRAVTKGEIISRNAMNTEQGICSTYVARAVLDKLVVPVLYKFYYDEEYTLKEGNRELAARWCAKYFPYVDLPVATVRVLPKNKDYGEGWLGGVQQFVKDAITADNVETYPYPWFNNGAGFDGFAAGVFDVLICNTDRHSGNWLWRDNPNRARKQRHVVLIDHGHTFRTYSELDWGLAGAYVGDSLRRQRCLTKGMVRGLTEIASRARWETRQWLNEAEANALAIRAARLVQFGTTTPIGK